MVTLEFKRPWKDGTRSIALDAKALLSRLSAIVPPPRRHITLYFGVLSSHSGWRSKIVPGPREEEEGPVPQKGPAESAPNLAVEAVPEPGTGPRSRYIPWHELLRRTFGSKVVCPDCGGKRFFGCAKIKLIALVKSETIIRILLVAMHLPSGPPKVASLKPAAVEVEESDGSGDGIDKDWAD